jgi:hypothetical protein
MLTAIRGIYRGGTIQLAEIPRNVDDDTPVSVTFLTPNSINLQERGIGEEQAAYLRARLATFVDDWDSLEMDIYNNYDAAKAGP